MDAILEFFSALPNEIYVFVISMLPIIELRGAIPVGAGLGIPAYINYPLSVIGNLLPVPFILYFISKILDFLAKFKFFRPIITWVRRKALKYSTKVIKEEKPTAEQSENEAPKTDAPSTAECGLIEAENKAPIITQSEAPSSDPQGVRVMSKAVFIALMLFVAIPLPGTGAWTGSLIAALFNLPKKRSLLAIALGVLISGVIMSLASYGVLGFLSIFL